MKRIMVDLGKCLGCHTCELACGAAHSQAGSFMGAVLAGERPSVSVHVTAGDGLCFPIQCRHCTDAPCAKACPVAALAKDEQTGGVMFDQDRCLGCMMCAMVCPFGSIAESGENSKVSKCDLCFSNDSSPSCVSACPTGALTYEDVDEFSSRRRWDFVLEYQNSEVEA